uniref:Uncharacterized protein n=1 Tax=Arundo donax TaxID=35708 RepID=A0A0A9FDF6_ARUDO
MAAACEAAPWTAPSPACADDGGRGRGTLTRALARARQRWRQGRGALARASSWATTGVEGVDVVEQRQGPEGVAPAWSAAAWKGPVVFGGADGGRGWRTARWRSKARLSAVCGHQAKRRVQRDCEVK